VLCRVVLRCVVWCVQVPCLVSGDQASFQCSQVGTLTWTDHPPLGGPQHIHTKTPAPAGLSTACQTRQAQGSTLSLHMVAHLNHLCDILLVECVLKNLVVVDLHSTGMHSSLATNPASPLHAGQMMTHSIVRETLLCLVHRIDRAPCHTRSSH
jgi:hypothetical protein